MFLVHIAGLLFFFSFFLQVMAQECEPFRRELNLTDIVERTFNNNLTIFEESQRIENSMGLWKQESGRFDANFSSILEREYIHQPVFATCIDALDSNERSFRNVKQQNATTRLEVSLEKRLRSGVLVRPSVRLIRTDLPCPDLPDVCFFQSSFCQIPNPQTLGQVRLSLEIPLLRNQGYENIGAGEISASLEYRASILNWKQEVARVIALVTRAYWNYNYAIKRFETYERAFQQTKEFLIGLEKLIAAGEIAATEAHQVRTDLETRRSNMERSQQEIFEAKQTLMVLMNIDPERFTQFEILRSKFLYPTIPETLEITQKVEEQWIESALSHRADFLALQYSEDASLALVHQAINALEPEFNINLDVYSYGLERGRGIRPYYKAFSKHVKGVNARGSVTLVTPICQTFERGVLQSRNAELHRIQFEAMDLKNNIKSQVLNRASAIRHSAKQLKALNIATREADLAVIDEFKKFTLGVSTVFDIIQLKDRSVSADLSLIEAQYNYVNTLIELNFFMGNILPPFEDICYIVEEKIIALPPLSMDS